MTELLFIGLFGVFVLGLAIGAAAINAMLGPDPDTTGEPWDPRR